MTLRPIGQQVPETGEHVPGPRTKSPNRAWREPTTNASGDAIVDFGAGQSATLIGVSPDEIGAASFQLL